MELKTPVVSLFDFFKVPENFSLEQKLQIQDACILAQRRFAGLSVEDEMKLNNGFVSVFYKEKLLNERDLQPDGGAAESDVNEVEVELNGNVDGALVPDSDDRDGVLGKHPCRLRGKAFDRKSSLKNHLVTHARQRDLEKRPESCERGADETPYRRAKASRRQGKLFECEVCRKTFNDGSNFRKHAMIHTGEKPFGCSECGRRFRIKHHWQQHEMRHREEFLFDCDFCGKLFVAKSTLQEHLKTHMKVRNAETASGGQRDFECAQCGKRFTAKKNLKQHTMRHSERKRYECGECGKEFHDKSNLNKHELIHTGQKSFQCGVCAKTFRLKHQRDRHWDSVHRDQEPGLNQG